MYISKGRYKILCASIAEHKDRRTRRLIWRHMKRIALLLGAYGGLHACTSIQLYAPLAT